MNVGVYRRRRGAADGGGEWNYSPATSGLAGIKVLKRELSRIEPELEADIITAIIVLIDNHKS